MKQNILFSDRKKLIRQNDRGKKKVALAEKIKGNVFSRTNNSILTLYEILMIVFFPCLKDLMIVFKKHISPDSARTKNCLSWRLAQVLKRLYK